MRERERKLYKLIRGSRKVLSYLCIVTISEFCYLFSISVYVVGN